MPGGFEQVDEASLAGARIGNGDIKSDAAIKPLKVERNPLYVPLNLGVCTLAASNTTRENNNDSPAIIFADAGEGYFVNTVAAPGEASPGSPLVVHIWWITAATSGQVRFVVDLKPLRAGFLTTSSAIQRQIIDDVLGTGNNIAHAEVEFPPGIFSNDMLIGIKIARDGTNALDTVGNSVKVLGAYLEIPGRC